MMGEHRNEITQNETWGKRLVSVGQISMTYDRENMRDSLRPNREGVLAYMERKWRKRSTAKLHNTGGNKQEYVGP